MEITFDTPDCHASLALIATEIFYRVNILFSFKYIAKNYKMKSRVLFFRLNVLRGQLRETGTNSDRYKFVIYAHETRTKCLVDNMTGGTK